MDSKFKVGDIVVFTNTDDYYPSWAVGAKSLGIEANWQAEREPTIGNLHRVISTTGRDSGTKYGVQSTMTLNCYIVGERHSTIMLVAPVLFPADLDCNVEEEEYDG